MGRRLRGYIYPIQQRSEVWLEYHSGAFSRGSRGDSGAVGTFYGEISSTDVVFKGRNQKFAAVVNQCQSFSGASYVMYLNQGRHAFYVCGAICYSHEGMGSIRSIEKLGELRELKKCVKQGRVFTVSKVTDSLQSFRRSRYGLLSTIFKLVLVLKNPEMVC